MDISKFKREKEVNSSIGFPEKIGKVLNTEIRFRKDSFGDRKKAMLYENLSVLLSSGLDIQNAFEIIKDSFKHKKDVDLIAGIEENIIQGSTLSEAFKETGRFTLHEYYSLKIGEETGKLIKVLKELEEYFKKKIEQRRKIVGAITYPMIVVITAILAVFFMMVFIVPMFEEVYQRFDRELPYLTRIVIDISYFFQQYSFLLFLFIMILMSLYFLFRKKESFKRIRDKLVARLPIIGELVKKHSWPGFAYRWNY
ncbi:MAG: type II secretion system F family protein [Bacteroidales bacterium]|nr:type II secretion system F family protein [Bacteroidales bacterium]